MTEREITRGVPPVQFLTTYSWKGGTINFTGATTPTEIRMEYAKQYLPFISPNQPIPVPYAVDAIAWAVLFMTALARGAPDAYRDRCSGMVDRELEQLEVMDVKRDQRMPRHRQAHRAGWRF